MNQIKKYNGIRCFIEDFIEQNRQFEMIDERRKANMKDRIKFLINHSKMENISLNGEVESKIKQVKINTKRTRNKRKETNIKLEKRKKKIINT